MQQSLSSRYTRLTAAFSLLITGAVFVIVVLSLLGRAMPLFPIGLIALALSLAALTIFGLPYLRVSMVSVDENNLYVSRRSREAVIPLTAVDAVHFERVLRLVVVHLKTRSDFGETIVFMPPLISRRYQGLSHPVVDELKVLVKQASAKPDAGT